MGTIKKDQIEKLNNFFLYLYHNTQQWIGFSLIEEMKNQHIVVNKSISNVIIKRGILLKRGSKRFGLEYKWGNPELKPNMNWTERIFHYIEKENNKKKELTEQTQKIVDLSLYFSSLPFKFTSQIAIEKAVELSFPKTKVSFYLDTLINEGKVKRIRRGFYMRTDGARNSFKSKVYELLPDSFTTEQFVEVCKHFGIINAKDLCDDLLEEGLITNKIGGQEEENFGSIWVKIKTDEIIEIEGKKVKPSLLKYKDLDLLKEKISLILSQINFVDKDLKSFVYFVIKKKTELSITDKEMDDLFYKWAMEFKTWTN